MGSEIPLQANPVCTENLTYSVFPEGWLLGGRCALVRLRWAELVSIPVSSPVPVEYLENLHNDVAAHHWI